MNGATIPTMKIEHALEAGVKKEFGDEDGPSPYMEEDDIYEDAGDLDFTSAQQQLWLSHIPKPLWDAFSTMGADEEIEIGTIRVEGPDAQPTRISLKLHANLPQFSEQPKEYILLNREKIKGRRAGQSFVFSEKDLPGHKSQPFAWNDLDEDGHPGQGRSYLYEKNKRDQKRKENKGRFQPYGRRPIPKQTAVAGIVGPEYECEAVRNEEFYVLESRRAEEMLKTRERPQTNFAHGQTKPLNQPSHLLSMAERSRINKETQARRQAAKDNRSARIPKDVLIDRLLELFRMHRIWALRDLKVKVSQPEAYLREVLGEIAFMWKNGDFNGKWELQDAFKERDASLMNPSGLVAPEADESELDRSGMDDDEDNETFEDV